VINKHNWLVHRIHDASLALAIRLFSNGLLLDIGCGEKPYQNLTKGIVKKHVGLDHPGSIHNQQHVDIIATAYETGLASNSIDTVLCTVVLEHIERPQDAVNEMFRVLKPGGYVILSTPLFWHLHEEPRDFYRYTKYGLEYLFTTAGFEIVEIKPLSGFVVTFSQELIYFFRFIFRGFLRFLLFPIQTFIQLLAIWLNRWDRSHGFTWAYLLVARKSNYPRKI
jgi:ubiquinone/menaquinone biosynthesis C-methylase UbiE